MNKVPVGILGSESSLGESYIELLRHHPWFELQATFEDEKTGNLTPEQCPYLLSALTDPVAEAMEPLYAEKGFIVISNAPSARRSKEVPVLIPEINPHHLSELFAAQKRRGWRGVLVAKPSSTLQTIALSLTPLHQRFRIRELFLTVLHSTVASDLEERIPGELMKILGEMALEEVKPLSVAISCHARREPALEGPIACISIGLCTPSYWEEIVALWREFNPPLPKLPSAPPRTFFREPEFSHAMAIGLKRLRPCPLLDYRFISYSSGERGGAGAGLLIAEFLEDYGIRVVK